MFDGERTEGIEASFGLRLGQETFRGSIKDGRLEIGRGGAEGADFIFTGTAAGLAAAVYGKQPLDALAKAGALTLEGDRALAERFTALFPLPPKVGSPSLSRGVSSL